MGTDPDPIQPGGGAGLEAVGARHMSSGQGDRAGCTDAGSMGSTERHPEVKALLCLWGPRGWGPSLLPRRREQSARVLKMRGRTSAVSEQGRWPGGAAPGALTEQDGDCGWNGEQWEVTPSHGSPCALRREAWLQLHCP